MLIDCGLYCPTPNTRWTLEPRVPPKNCLFDPLERVCACALLSRQLYLELEIAQLGAGVLVNDMQQMTQLTQLESYDGKTVVNQGMDYNSPAAQV